MKKETIKKHLRPYSIYQKRKTTIVHAFASALSVADNYDENNINKALRLLGQDPDKDLLCVYCNQPAETWDHIMAVVKNGKFSGYGHQIGNLMPCCKDCNSKKGNRDWKTFLISKHPDEASKPDLIDKIEFYISNNTTKFEELLDEDINSEIAKLKEIEEQICNLFKIGDRHADLIRDKLKQKSKVLTQ
jgi:5-methylcytosine-specific restriction endonuclease McrA